MDPYVADPEWHGLIIWYFYLGGIAAGSFAMASLATLFGDESARRGTRAADYLAFPIVCVCGVLLIVDLGRPERFWHMMIASETWRPMFKWWSPMSVGSWGLSAFGACSSIAFASVVVEDGWIGADRLRERVLRLRRGLPGRIVALGGAVSAFFLGSYTGVLLGATNQPVWSDTTWIAPLFLASAASTGVAMTILVSRWRLHDVGHDVIHRLEVLDLWAIGLETLLLGAFLLSLDGLARPAISRWPGLLVPLVVVPLGLVIPILLHWVKWNRASLMSSTLVLIAGFALRAAVVGMPAVFRVGA
jgi:protein NrfD